MEFSRSCSVYSINYFRSNFLGNEVICFPLILSCLAYILSCILWWYQNRDNDSFKNIGENALGGSPEQFN